MNYYLILDSNVWVSERLLYSAMGSALLHTLTQGGGVISIPEIVRTEVDRVVTEQAAKAVESVRKSAVLLRQMSGHAMEISAPSDAAIQAGVMKRWNELAGILHSVPFTFDQAKSALRRIIEKSAPCGPNNEQFRDCCIWQSALDLSANYPVHLVTNDRAFYDGGDLGNLASSLSAEAASTRYGVKVYPSLTDFLTSIDSAITRIDEPAIVESIVNAVTEKAKEIVGDNGKLGEFELGALRKPKIIGYATPKPTLVAVSFALVFNMSRVQVGGGGEEQRQQGELSIGGSCSFDPKTRNVADVEIRNWSKYLKSGGYGFIGTHSPDANNTEQFRAENFRRI